MRRPVDEERIRELDIRIVPESDALLRAIPGLKEKLSINVELASPEDFLPALPGWQDRSNRKGRSVVRTESMLEPAMQMKRNRSSACLVLLVAVACETPERDLGDAGPIEAVGFTDVKLTDEFWAPRMEVNRKVTIPHLARQNEETGRIDNFRKAAGLLEGPFVGYRFNDSDVYKSIEAASYSLAQTYDPALDAELDELISLVASSQMDDGYIFPAYTIDPENPPVGVSKTRWELTNSNSHELYGNGHLIEAAVAHHRATGKRSLLDVAIRAADHIDSVFGPDGRRDTSGHEEIELALVKLYDLTGEKRYLELAKFFIDQRGQEHDSPGEPEGSELAKYDHRTYRQDHLPVVEQREAVGHSVRAMYLYMGMADVAARTEAPGYREALEALWDDVAAKKMYLTGGIGAAGSMESFGEAYELPNQSAYAETCAAIGNEMWNYRMFLASGESRYLDVVERILYNGFLSGVSLEGNSFFYTNPLESDGDDERREYFNVACCPSNLARLMGQLPGFVYAREGERVYVNLFIGSEAEIALPDGTLKLTQETRFPWDGAMHLILDPDTEREVELRIRIPGWARDEPVPSDLYAFADEFDGKPALRVNGVPVMLQMDEGFAVLRQSWKRGDTVEVDLPMPVRRVRAHENVRNNAGRLALQRGPLVYAFEAIDNGGKAIDVVLAEDAVLETEFRKDMLGGVTVVHGGGLLAIPYFAWANRGPGEMAVWLEMKRPVH
jgi:hypothetical protein